MFCTSCDKCNKYTRSGQRTILNYQTLGNQFRNSSTMSNYPNYPILAINNLIQTNVARKANSILRYIRNYPATCSNLFILVNVIQKRFETFRIFKRVRTMFKQPKFSRVSSKLEYLDAFERQRRERKKVERGVARKETTTRGGKDPGGVAGDPSCTVNAGRRVTRIPGSTHADRSRDSRKHCRENGIIERRPKYSRLEIARGRKTG